MSTCSRLRLQRNRIRARFTTTVIRSPRGATLLACAALSIPRPTENRLEHSSGHSSCLTNCHTDSIKLHFIVLVPRKPDLPAMFLWHCAFLYIRRVTFYGVCERRALATPFEPNQAHGFKWPFCVIPQIYATIAGCLDTNTVIKKLLQYQTADSFSVKFTHTALRRSVG